jgi:hypothetical protein
MNLDTYNGQNIKRYNKPDIIKCILENKKNWFYFFVYFKII